MKIAIPLADLSVEVMISGGMGGGLLISSMNVALRSC